MKFSREDASESRLDSSRIGSEEHTDQNKKEEEKDLCADMPVGFTYFIAPVEILAHMIDTYSTSFNFP